MTPTMRFWMMKMRGNIIDRAFSIKAKELRQYDTSVTKLMIYSVHKKKTNTVYGRISS